MKARLLNVALCLLSADLALPGVAVDRFTPGNFELSFELLANFSILSDF